jgi:hypothetical protein
MKWDNMTEIGIVELPNVGPTSPLGNLGAMRDCTHLRKKFNLEVSRNGT